MIWAPQLAANLAVSVLAKRVFPLISAISIFICDCRLEKIESRKFERSDRTMQGAICICLQFIRIVNVISFDLNEFFMAASVHWYFSALFTMKYDIGQSIDANEWQFYNCFILFWCCKRNEWIFMHRSCRTHKKAILYSIFLSLHAVAFQIIWLKRTSSLLVCFILLNLRLFMVIFSTILHC